MTVPNNSEVDGLPETAPSTPDTPDTPAVQAHPMRLPVKVVFNGIEIAHTEQAIQLVEPDMPPVLFIPLDDVRMAAMVRTSSRRVTRHSGEASFYDVIVADLRAERGAFIYAVPPQGCEIIRGHVSFCPQTMDKVLIDGVPFAGVGHECQLREQLVKPTPPPTPATTDDSGDAT